MKNILQEIARLRKERNWSEYELSKNTGIAQSTISTWYRRNQVPTLETLEKVCKGFNITLSQFFSEGEEAMCLTAEQKELLDNWAALTREQQELFLALFRTIP